jgi:hypothetical protein
MLQSPGRSKDLPSFDLLGLLELASLLPTADFEGLSDVFDSQHHDLGVGGLFEPLSDCTPFERLPCGVAGIHRRQEFPSQL